MCDKQSEADERALSSEEAVFICGDDEEEVMCSEEKPCDPEQQ